MQEASIAGSGNTIVQIVGDGNSITAGYKHLTLTRHLGWRQIRQDLDRLSPYTRAIPLLGRETELASLHAFLCDARPLLARVLVGGAGSGKTRLALEFCEQASATGWNAGFVTGTELGRFVGEQNLSDWGWQKSTLIVVDNAAGHAELLRNWLDELTDHAAPPQHALRLLLLERSASIDTGWWTTVFASGGWGAANKRAVLDPPEPVPILPLAHAEDRLALLKAMLAQASPHRPIDVPVDDAVFRDRLMQLAWGGDPLFLMMAALEMVQLGHAGALALTRTDLADAIAWHEAERLQQLAQASTVDRDLVQHLAACVTLAQGMSREDFERFATSEKAAIGHPSGGDAAVLADVLQEALPHPNGIAPLQPDLIGEALIMRAMRKDGRASAVLRCHAAFGRAVAQSVIICAQDFGQQSPAPLQWLEGIMDSLADAEDELAALEDSLPESVVLRDFRLKVTGRLHVLLEARFAARGEVPLHDRADVLHRLARAREKAGRWESALEPMLEAVEYYRILAAQYPDAFLHGLALSLRSLSAIHSALGQYKPALEAAQEAVEHYRKLATQQPDVFRPQLGLSLTTLANGFSELGRHEAALQAAQEALDLVREYAARQGIGFKSGLATSLDTLANVLVDSNQRKLALEAAREAVELFRELAAQAPDVFRPDLARTLGNLAGHLGALGERAPAVQAAQEALELYRNLAAQHPDLFRPDLSLSLTNLANALVGLGQPQPAAQVGQEAVELFRELLVTTEQRDAIRTNLALSLTNLSVSRNALGQHEPALQAAQEALELYRELAEQRPDMFRHALAKSFHNLAWTHWQLEQREFALHAELESLELYRELAAKQPDVFRADLARSLHNLASMRNELGRRGSALQAEQESFELFRELAAQQPHVFRPDLAWSFHSLASLRKALGQGESALQAEQESLELFRELAARQPDIFRPDLANSLHNLASMLTELGQRESALQAEQESFELFRELAAQQPDMFRPDLARSFHNLASLRRALGQGESALQAEQESLELFRELAARQPDIFRPDLAKSLHNLAWMRSEVGQHESALQAAQEASKLFRELAAQQPDMFRPDLAKSLMVLALRTRDVSGATEALQFAREAIVTLAPESLRHSNAHAGLIKAVGRGYLQLCESAACVPDRELLEPMLPYLVDKE